MGPVKALDLFFHSPCFDGIASAVVCLDFFAQRGEANIVRLHPVGYERKESWLTTSLPPRSAVVDFLFHPTAMFWIDHHPTTFLTEAVEKQFQAAHSTSWVYDNRSHSCAALLRKHLRRSFRYHNPKYDALVDWADLIDSAAYRDVKQAVLAPTAALQISLSLGGAEPEYCERLVRQLRKQSISRVAASPHVQRRVRTAKASMREGLRQFGKTARLEDEIVVFDFDARNSSVSRYAPYYFYPKARYSIGLMRSGSDAKITAMRNPWRRFESVPIGSIFARYGGGGHQRVGSVILKGDANRNAQKILTELLGEIRDRDRAQSRHDS
jgi:hypothetical protein